ncbi:MAG: hypothetical protein QXU21_01070 [Candidatus Bathyarchaeia archaeon]
MGPIVWAFTIQNRCRHASLPETKVLTTGEVVATPRSMKGNIATLIQRI